MRLQSQFLSQRKASSLPHLSSKVAAFISPVVKKHNLGYHEAANIRIKLRFSHKLRTETLGKRSKTEKEVFLDLILIGW